MQMTPQAQMRPRPFIAALSLIWLPSHGSIWLFKIHLSFTAFPYHIAQAFAIAQAANFIRNDGDNVKIICISSL